MYRFGLRASETTLLLLEDLDLARGRIRIRRAKGGDAKEYPLPRDLAPVLKRYLRKRPDRGMESGDMVWSRAGTCENAPVIPPRPRQYR